jgi:hypothetical protein
MKSEASLQCAQQTALDPLLSQLNSFTPLHPTTSGFLTISHLSHA